MDHCKMDLTSLYTQIRKRTETICQPLAIEDYVIQAMPDVSPPKWHLAHVTWFFETFLLVPYVKNYRAFNPAYAFLFNSYYEGLGKFYPRANRGTLSRPTVEEIYRYRKYVDESLLAQLPQFKEHEEFIMRLEVGLHHEQQHQELMLMDIKYNFAHNPLRPCYIAPKKLKKNNVITNTRTWSQFAGALHEIGYAGPGFSYDDERPRHLVYVNSFQIADHLVTNGEYLEFILSGGYQKPQYWLSDGWYTVRKENWHAPLYWEKINGDWWLMTLQGLQKLDPLQPVSHVSYYEADAYARWAKCRLPTEFEWEVAAQNCKVTGNFFENGNLHPIAAEYSNDSRQFFGDVWEWTQSSFAPYPGYIAFKGLLSEYNAKFTCNQFVLRGGCAVTPTSHIRLTYRDFYYPHQRWPFTGIRLARDL